MQQDPQVLRGLLDPLVRRDLKARLDQKGPKARKVSRARLARRAPLGLKDPRVLRANRDQPVQRPGSRTTSLMTPMSPFSEKER